MDDSERNTAYLSNETSPRGQLTSRGFGKHRYTSRGDTEPTARSCSASSSKDSLETPGVTERGIPSRERRKTGIGVTRLIIITSVHACT